MKAPMTYAEVEEFLQLRGWPRFIFVAPELWIRLSMIFSRVHHDPFLGDYFQIGPSRIYALALGHDIDYRDLFEVQL